jgi:hypothetical protein
MITIVFTPIIKVFEKSKGELSGVRYYILLRYICKIDRDKE